MPIQIAQDLTRRQFELYKSDDHGIIPDGKAQISLKQEVRGNKLVPIGIDTLTVAAAHDQDVPIEELREFLYREQVKPVLDRYDLALDDDSVFIINALGPWHVYGPPVDAGVTNRKIIAQAYGLAARHGGGGWSGKDPTKIDRSGALFARHIALNLVASNIVDTCEITVSYSFGQPEPHFIRVKTFDTNKAGWINERIAQLVREKFSWSVSEMMQKLQLWQSIYERTNFDGVFGMEDYPWEKPEL